jgi:hypothetical protein
MNKNEIFELMDGDISVWIEQDIIFLRAVERPSGDPVELTPAEARELAEKLRQWADELED